VQDKWEHSYRGAFLSGSILIGEISARDIGEGLGYQGIHALREHVNTRICGILRR